tara:strand:- start:392 stop:2047 length:1656 start_codon:yes stop_codon:yes gene_type:complete
MSQRLVEQTGGEIVWLLELTFAGKTIRRSSEPVSISKAAGGVLKFHGGMDPPAFEQSLERLNTSVSSESMSMELDIGEDVVKMIAKGHQLSAALCEVSYVMQVGGTIQQTYEQRVVAITGLVSEPQYGFLEEPEGYITFSIDSGLLADSGTFISEKRVISWAAFDNLFPEIADFHAGKAYPIVFGNPGQYRVFDSVDGAVSVTAEGSPAYIVAVTYSSVTKESKADTVLVAGHHVSAGTVRITNPGKDNGVYNATVTNTSDNYGAAIATADISGAGSDFRLSREFYAIWDADGGLPNPFRAGELNGAGDILRWALRYSDLDVDHAAWAAASAYLNRYSMSGFINDPEATVWDWVDDILKLLPVSIQQGPKGLYPVVYDPFTSVEHCYKVTASGSFQRISHVQAEGTPGDLVNAVRVGYALNAFSNDPSAYVAVGSDPDNEDSFATVGTRVSVGRYGNLPETVEAANVWDRGTAAKIAKWRAAIQAFPRLTMQYVAAPSYGNLMIGDMIALTDSDIYLTDQVCTVVSKAWDVDCWVFTILIDTIPGRDTLYS